jgi:hypothetical protein
MWQACGILPEPGNADKRRQRRKLLWLNAWA